MLGRYTYHLSDGQKWNARRLKRFLPRPVEWTVLPLPVHVQPQGGVGGLEAENAGERGAEHEVEEIAWPEPDVLMPGPVEPRYPAWDRRAPESLGSSGMAPSEERGEEMIYSRVRVLLVCLLCIFPGTVFLCCTTGRSDKGDLIVNLAAP